MLARLGSGWARLRTLVSVAHFTLWHAARGAAAPRDAQGPDVLPDEAPPPPAMPGSALYRHTAHPHVPAVAQNANARHRARQAQAGLNERVAVWLTQHVGSMACAYAFCGIGVGSLVGVFTGNVFLAALFGSVSSYFLQLVLLPIISVGTNVLGHHQEVQADETYHNTLRAEHHLMQIMAHLGAQDDELLRQSGYLVQLVERMAVTFPGPSSAPPSGDELATLPTVASPVARPPDATPPSPSKPPRAARKK